MLRKMKLDYILIICTLMFSGVKSVKYGCHCEAGCDGDDEPSVCGSDCATAWSGETCQRRNIALHQNETYQLGVYSTFSPILNRAVTGSSDKAVDGNTNKEFLAGGCSHTKQESAEHEAAFWTVILDNPHLIYNIRIYQRENPYLHARLNGFEVTVDNELCFKWTEASNPSFIIDVHCENAMMGRNITITIPIPNALGPVLTLCEVELYECSDFTFGETCDKLCQCSNVDEVCHKITGECKSGCSNGFIGLGCQQPCPEFRYGADCQYECGHCALGISCDHINGSCPGGCVDGWEKDLCGACSDGKYGPNCEEHCGHCITGATCNTQTGDCPGGCEERFSGTKCITCKGGWFGKNCDACDLGYAGLDCAKCGHCENSDPCDKMTRKCPSGCENGWQGKTCIDCADGRQGNHCNETCSSGYFGSNCGRVCGHCKDGVNCNTIDGTCPGACQDGYAGTDCVEQTQTLPIGQDNYKMIMIVSVVAGVYLLLFFLLLLFLGCWCFNRCENLQP